MSSEFKEELCCSSQNSKISIFGLKIHRAWVMLLGCCVIQAVTGAMLFGCYGNFYVPICNDFGCNRSDIGIFQTLYFIAMIPAFPIAAKLIDTYSIRVIMSISLFMIIVSVIAMSMFTAPWMFAISGCAIGIFSTTVFHMPTVIIVNNWFAKYVGVAMGLSTAVGALFTVFMSPILANIISAVGWRDAFRIEAIIMAIAGLPWCLFVFRISPKCFGGFPYGISTTEEMELFKPASHDSSLNITHVKFGKEMLAVPFIMLFLFGGIASFIGKGYDPHIAGYAESLGFDATFGALMISVMNLGSFIEKMFMGLVNDKFGVWKGVAIEIILITIGIVFLIFSKTTYALLIGAFLFGVQDSLTGVSLPLLVREIYNDRRYNQVFAWTKVGGGVLSAFATMAIGACYDVTGSYVPAFVLCGGLCLICSITVYFAWKTKDSVRICENI
jgi:MFS family permease